MWEINFVFFSQTLMLISWCSLKNVMQNLIWPFSYFVFMTCSVSWLMPLEFLCFFFLTLSLLFVVLFMSLLLFSLAYNHYNPDKICFLTFLLAQLLCGSYSYLNHFPFGPWVPTFLICLLPVVYSSIHNINNWRLSTGKEEVTHQLRNGARRELS